MNVTLTRETYEKLLWRLEELAIRLNGSIEYAAIGKPLPTIEQLEQKFKVKSSEKVE